MLGILVGAGVLGLIVATMEEGDFPGWFSMSICVLAATIPVAIINAFLHPALSFIGLSLGAVCAGCAISATCGMSVKRATIAGAIYLAIQTNLSLALYTMTR